ncbi:MAG: hypothetical protein WC505_05210 [Patescibacteria group bacterium]
MDVRHDNRGISAVAIILLGMMALSVVLLDGISINLKQKEEARAAVAAGLQRAVALCGNPAERLPEDCPIVAVYQCDANYILTSDCMGVGDVLLSGSGEYVAWCGYASIDTAVRECGRYWLDAEGNDCTLGNNLCSDL